MLGEDREDETDARSLTAERFDPKRTSATIAVVNTISSLEGIDPQDLRPLLADVIDGDALNDVCNSVGGGAVVEFIYTSYRVLVDCSGAVRIYEAES